MTFTHKFRDYLSDNGFMLSKSFYENVKVKDKISQEYDYLQPLTRKILLSRFGLQHSCFECRT